MSKVHAYLLANDGSHAPAVVMELDESWGRTWQEQLSSEGAGSVNLQKDDPDRSSIAFGQPIKFTLDAVDVFTIVVEAFEGRFREQEEEQGQYDQITGRGLMGEWDRGLVYPPLGPGLQPVGTVRTLGWQDPTYVSSGHPLVVVQSPTLFGPPDGWPNDAADWIWDRDTSGGAPVGPVFFWHSFSLGVDTRCQLWSTADDRHRLFVDGVPVTSDEAGGYHGQATHAEVFLSAGNHVIAAAANNENAGHAGLRVSLMIANDDGTLTPLGVNSDGSWHCLGYPAADPGTNAGQALRTLLAEAQARGELPGWTTGFDDVHDSDGNVWDGPFQFPFDLGIDLLSAIKQLAEAYCDVAAAPASRTLYAWNLGGRGSVTAHTLTPGSSGTNVVHGNLTSLSHQAQGRVTNRLLVFYSGGPPFVLNHTGSQAIHGIQSAPLRLDAVTDHAEAVRIATGLIEQEAFARVATSASMDPEGTSDIPYVDFFVGDWVNAPSQDGTVTSQRVRAVTVKEDDQGLAGYDIEANDILLETDDLLRRHLKRAANGALGGRTAAASFTAPAGPPMLAAPVTEIPPFTILDGTPNGTLSPGYEMRAASRLTGGVFKANGTGSSNSVVDVFANGTHVGTLTLPAASTRVEAQFTTDWLPGDTCQVRATTMGGHTGMQVQLRTTK